MLKRKAISTLISTAFIVLLTIMAMALTLTIGMPAINKAKEASVINEALQNMKVIDNTIREVASEGAGSLRSPQIKVSGGEYRVNQKANSVDFTYTIKYGLFEPGTFVKDGNLLLMSGVNAKASTYDLDNDGSNELVLENEILRVGLLSSGTSSSQASINTSGIIKLLNIKESGANVTLTDSSVTLDDFADSSSGTGYTELVIPGDHLSKAEAVVHMSTATMTYDIVYTLQSGADFLIIKIQNAYYK
jgi:hypothetical protein